MTHLILLYGSGVNIHETWKRVLPFPPLIYLGHNIPRNKPIMFLSSISFLKLLSSVHGRRVSGFPEVSDFLPVLL